MDKRFNLNYGRWLFKISILLCTIMLIYVFKKNMELYHEGCNSYVLSIFFILFYLIVLFLIGKTNPKNEHKKKIILSLLSISIIIRLMWVYEYSIIPSIDYGTFYNLANELSQNIEISMSRYIALFPHIFGYSYFLSIIFRAFGTNLIVPPIINVLLSGGISLVFIFLISEKISGIKSAIYASLIWIFFPSQIIYNMYTFSEPLYTALILIVWYMVINYQKKLIELNNDKKYFILYTFIISLLLAAINSIRPIALIILISLIIDFLVFRISIIFKIKKTKRVFCFIFIILFIYVLSGEIINKGIESKLGEKIATVPGATMYFGFNEGSNGSWNLEDAQLLSTIDEYNISKNRSADYTQKQMLELTKKRIKENKLNYYKFILTKTKVLWTGDASAIYYLNDSANNNVMRESIKEKLIIISNSYYSAIIFLVIIASILMVIKKNMPLGVPIIILFLIGLTTGHILAEASPRYHYSGIAAFTILAANTNFFNNDNNKKNISNKNTIE